MGTPRPTNPGEGNILESASICYQWALAARVRDAALAQQKYWGRPGHHGGKVRAKARSPEEIQEQLEARYKELQEEAARPKCKTCKYHEIRKTGYHGCANALVRGFDKFAFAYDSGYETKESDICGPEKALWEPIPPKWSMIDRAIIWAINLFRKE